MNQAVLKLVTAVLPVFLPACAGAPPPEPRVPAPERHRALLVRDGALFVQARMPRVREAMPMLGEAVRLAAISVSPGAGCLVDLLWSADLVSAVLATGGSVERPTSGGALLEGSPVPPERVDAWVDCFLSGLGSGRVETSFPAADDAAVRFVVGTGSAADVGVGSRESGSYAVVVAEPFDRWAGALAASPVERRSRAVVAGADLVTDADVVLLWPDPPAAALVLGAASAGLASAPPPAEILGMTAGLWLGDRPRTVVFFPARGPEAAAMLAEAVRTALTVLQLAGTVVAAQLGAAHGRDVQARAERVVELLKRADVRVTGAVARVLVDLSVEDLELVQDLLMALAGRGFDVP